MDLREFTALELGRKIKQKEIGVVEAAKAALCAQEKYAHYNSFVTVCKERALKQAEAVQKKIDSGELASPLAGVPGAIKDLLCTEGIRTTCGSKMLSDFIPTYTATLVKKFMDAGIIITGKLNMDEYAMGSTTETSYFGPVKNPWNCSRVPGGSSGGSAASLLTGEAMITLGSDTGGSIRQPCSFCGLTGIKPTYGRVSRYGVVAYASSLDQVGPMGRNVEDVAAALAVISGYDAKDSTSVKLPPYSPDFSEGVKGKKIGFPTECFGEGIDPEVKNITLAAIKKFEDGGAVVEEFSMPELKYVIPAYYIIACAEASSNLSRYDGIKYGYSAHNFKELSELYYKNRGEGFGPEVQRRILIGAFVLSSGYYDAYYKKAQQVRSIIKKGFDTALEKYDAVLSPTAPNVAPKIGETLSDPLKMYLGDIYTVSVNLAGLPGLVVPCGFNSQKMPVGLQIITKPFDENTALGLGYYYQQVTAYHTALPELKTGKEACAV